MGILISTSGGGGVGITALTGDVTGSGTGSVATTIANDSVSYAKIQNVSATDKVLGRSTAGAGDAEEIACTAAGRALIDDADAAAQRTTLGLGTLATQSGTFSGTSSGTNTGDQDVGEVAINSAQFDKTNSAALANVPGLSVTVATGKKYTFSVLVVLDADFVAGFSVGLAGTAVVAAISARYEVDDANTTSAIYISHTATFPGSVVATSGFTDAIVVIEGTISVTTGGTLTVTFAQNIATPVTTSSVLALGYLKRSAGI